MSSIAILSDIHSNLRAFQAVLKDAREAGAEQFVFLGDVVGYGAFPSECVTLVQEHGGQCVMGNHEVAVLSLVESMRHQSGDRRRGGACGYTAGLIHSARSLDPRKLSWLESLPYTLPIPGAVAAHANLQSPRSFGYITDSLSAGPSLAALATQVFGLGFFGHTHLQEVFPGHGGGVEWLDDTSFHVPKESRCVVMVGSVGLPRHPTDRSAAWVLWDPEARIIELKRTEYDRVQAAGEVIRAGLPSSTAIDLLTAEEAKEWR